MQPFSTPMKISENREVRTNELNFEYNTNGHNKNYNIAKKCQKKSRRQLYCFDYKMALKEFTFKNREILSRVDCEPAANLEITTLTR